MRRVLAVMLAVCMIMCVMSAAGFAEEIEERGDDVDFDGPAIEEFPADGVCRGDNVRFRTGPGTNYKILGKLKEFDRVVVRGSRWINGDVWYKIDDPRGRRGTVWVAGWYIEPFKPDME